MHAYYIIYVVSSNSDYINGKLTYTMCKQVACILHIVSSNSDLEDSRTLCVSGFIEAAECFFCALLFSFSAPTVLRTHTGPYVSRFQLV